MAYNQNAIRRKLNDYKNVRTIPASVSAAFIVASLFLFGGMGTVDLVWFNYSLTPQHAVFGSGAAYIIAFMSSQTDDFGRYDTWEQVAILAGPATTIGWHYFGGYTQDLFLMVGDPLGAQIAFVITVFSWGVMAR
jgi:hypothetical protein